MRGQYRVKAAGTQESEQPESMLLSATPQGRLSRRCPFTIVTRALPSRTLGGPLDGRRGYDHRGVCDGGMYPNAHRYRYRSDALRVSL